MTVSAFNFTEWSCIFSLSHWPIASIWSPGWLVLHLGLCLQILSGWTRTFYRLLQVRSNCLHMRPWTFGNKSRLQGMPLIQWIIFFLAYWLFKLVLTPMTCLNCQDVCQVFCFISCSIPSYLSTSASKWRWEEESNCCRRCLYSSFSKGSSNC